MALDERLDLAQLSRSSEFTSPRERHVGAPEPIVAMRFVPRQTGEWERVKYLWLALPRHPNILQAVGCDDHGDLLVRYAAINWEYGPIQIDDALSVHRVATWGVQLTDALGMVVEKVSVNKAGWLSRIVAHVDLDNHMRIGFLPVAVDDPVAPDRWPVEVLQAWPACDERGFVFVAGQNHRSALGNQPARPFTGHLSHRDQSVAPPPDA